MADVVVRTATLHDLDALRDVFRRAALSNEGDRANMLAHPELLVFEDAAVREGRTIAVLDGDRLTGFASTSRDGEHLELDDLFVDPDRRREGHATRLMAAIVEAAQHDGAIRVEVTGNEHAREFYERIGFRQVGMAETRFALVPRMHLDV